MSNFDLSNQNNDDVKEGLSTNQNNYSNFTNKYDDDGLTTAPVNKPVEETGNLSVEKPIDSTEREPKPRSHTERNPRGWSF